LAGQLIAGKLDALKCQKARITRAERALHALCAEVLENTSRCRLWRRPLDLVLRGRV
jgi:hypothetical protein